MSNSKPKSAEKSPSAQGIGKASQTAQPKILLHYHPWSRAAGTRWLLEELGVPYDIHFVDFNAPGGAPESYRAIHPHKKVPAVEIGGEVLTERAAITIDLADRFPEAGLAPALGDPLRSGYLRMLVYCDSVLDPCVAARAHKLDYVSNDYSFGSFEDMIQNLQNHLRKHDFAAGSRFTAADTQLGSSLGFTMHVLKVVPSLPEFHAYLARVADRPAHLRAQQLDAELMQGRTAGPTAAAE
jgi:glutathione S-transferase